MQPQPSLNLIPTIQQAITSLLMTHEPEFIRFGYRLFTAFATILISWHGVRMMFSHEGLNDRMFEFAKLLRVHLVRLLVHRLLREPAAGHRGLVQQPDHRPGGLLPVGARGAGVRQHLPALRHAVGALHAAGPVVDPGEPDLLDGAPADRLRQGRVAGGHRVRPDRQRRVRAAGAASSCRSSSCPKLDWLFWGWLRSFIQYSFVPVVAIAFLMVFEQFVFRYITTLPPTITQAEYGVYGIQAFAVVATFCTGILLVPSLTQSIFSGSSGESAMPTRLSISRLAGRR